MQIPKLHLEITYKKAAIVYGFPSAVHPANDEPRQQYRINICNLSNKKRSSFSFTGSIADYEKGNDVLKQRDLGFAAYCFFSDAQSAIGTFSNFCAEFGYDEDSRTAEKIYKTCKRSLEKVKGLGFDEDKIYEALNFLNETYS